MDRIFLPARKAGRKSRLLIGASHPCFPCRYLSSNRNGHMPSLSNGLFSSPADCMFTVSSGQFSRRTLQTVN